MKKKVWLAGIQINNRIHYLRDEISLTPHCIYEGEAWRWASRKVAEKTAKRASMYFAGVPVIHEPGQTPEVVHGRLDPEIFIEAAGLVASGEHMFCCPALLEAVRKFNDPESYYLLLKMYFKPDDFNENSPWFRYGDRMVRVTALLMCAEICKDRNWFRGSRETTSPSQKTCSRPTRK